MANALNRDLENCEVILAREYYPEDEPQWAEEAQRTVFVTGGFGAAASTNGNALFVRQNDGTSFRAEGYMVEKFVREVPEDERAITYVVNVMSEQGVETYEVSAVTTTNATSQVLQQLGWGLLPHRFGVTHDDVLIEVDGVEYALSPKKKG